MARVALITGIAGQDGYYLSQLLRPKGYEIYGVDRPGKRPEPGLCTRAFELDLAQAAGRRPARRSCGPTKSTTWPD